METPLRSRHLICFGAFEFDPHTGELRKHGMKLKLQGHAIDALAIMLEHPGELVTREDLRKRLWSADTFVDFEHSLNAAVKRLREVLDDSAERPRFIETLPRHGYRFIAPLNVSPSLDSTTYRTEQQSSSLHSESSAAGRNGTANIVASEGKIPPQDKELHSGQRRQGRVPTYKIGVLVVGLFAVFAAVVITLNVGGLRDRWLSVVGGRRTVVSTPKIESIAVLPLENLSGDKEQEYFADGMTEALINDLGKISALRVISRTSVMQYKGTRKPLPEIARELNVDSIVEGTVLRFGNRVRITANLLHAPSDRHLWADAYERDLRDVLALQDEVARAITSEIQIKVTPDEQVRLASARPLNPEAYALYLQGRYYFSKRTLPAFDKSIQLFKQVLEKEPGSALAYAGLAESYGISPFYSGALPRVSFPKAKAAALKALELDGSLAEAHAALAFVLNYWDWDWLAAERELKRAIELNPNYVVAHHWYAEYLGAMGRHEQAIAEIKRAQELDPLSPLMFAIGGTICWRARRYDEAVEQCRKALELDPNYALGHSYLGEAYLGKGMYEKAITEFEEATRLYGNDPGTRLSFAYAVKSRRSQALKILSRITDQWRQGDVQAIDIARVHVGLGERKQALDWLEKAYEERDPNMAFLKVLAVWDPLRSDPRFQDLLRRMNFSP